jgi:outer membrane protein assembly factor BamB
MAIYRSIRFVITLLSCTLLCTSAHAAEPSLDLVPTALWKTSLRKTGKMGRGLYQFGAPVVAGDQIFVGSASGGVYAVQTANGKVTWTFATEGPVFAPVRVIGEKIYAVDSKGVVYAMQTSDGEELWRVDIGVESMATPLVQGNRLYVATMRGELLAIDAETGAMLWRTPGRLATARFEVRGASDPVYIAPHIVVGYADGRVVAHSPANGSIAWERRITPRHAILHDVDTTPYPFDGRILVGSSGGGLSALERRQGRFQWRNDFATSNDLFLHGDRLYVAGGGTLYALDPKTGTPHWQTPFDDESGLATPIIVNGRLITVSTNHVLYLLEPSTGEVLGKRHLGTGTYGRLAANGDRLYVLTNASRLIAMQVP